MKRLLSFAIFFLLSVPIVAQTLGYRDEDETHVTIGTNYVYEGEAGFLIKPRTAVALGYLFHKDTGDEIYSLDFLLQTYRGEFSIDKNACLFIKTFQDKIITLHHLQTNTEVKKDSELISARTGSYRHLIYPHYIISKEDLQTLMNEGVKKLSFLTTAGYHILNYDKDSIGAILVKEFELLHGKTNFNEGF